MRGLIRKGAANVTGITEACKGLKQRTFKPIKCIKKSIGLHCAVRFEVVFFYSRKIYCIILINENMLGGKLRSKTVNKTDYLLSNLYSKRQKPELVGNEIRC